MMSARVLVLGAAGRDFHNFHVALRDDPAIQVVAFTAAQIPGIDARRYPAALAGPRYPEGIPIVPEAELEQACRNLGVTEVVFAYSDLSHPAVMHLASRALACGADFRLLGPDRTMVSARRPVLAISAVRTGCGKSQIARWAADRLAARGHRVAVLRHPMPYGDLLRQRVQRFAVPGDLDAAACTLEEREEYEPHLAAGHVVHVGVDTPAVVAAATADGDVLLWEGGNNDFPFVRPDRHVVVVDALRPDQVSSHHPGEANIRLADAVVVNKANAAARAAVRQAVDNVRALRPDVPVFLGASEVTLPPGTDLRGLRVMVVEDGPSLTHGGMATGAGHAAALAAGVAEIVDPRPYAVGAVRDMLERHPHIGAVLPALGYSEAECAALARSIGNAAVDVVIAGTPIDLSRALGHDIPVVRARYDFVALGTPSLEDWLADFPGDVGAPR
jgi:predicted GTPase